MLCKQGVAGSSPVVSTTNCLLWGYFWRRDPSAQGATCPLNVAIRLSWLRRGGTWRRPGPGQHEPHRHGTSRDDTPWTVEPLRHEQAIQVRLKVSVRWRPGGDLTPVAPPRMVAATG